MGDELYNLSEYVDARKAVEQVLRTQLRALNL